MRTHTALALTSLLLIAGCGSNVAVDEQTGSAESAVLDHGRGYSAAYFRLELDGAQAGWVHSVEGGMPAAENVTEKVPSITMRVPFQSPVVLGWVRDYLAGKSPRKSGAIVHADANREIRWTREFANALITEIGFPALDGSSKDPSYLTVKFAPEYTRLEKGSGATLAPPDESDATAVTPSVALALPGLAALKVSKLDALTIKQTAVTDDIGDARDYAKEPGSIEIPNLVMSFSDSSADALGKWFDSFVIEGQNDQSQEKTGALEFLDPVRQTVVVVNLQSLRSCTITRAEATATLSCANLTVDTSKSVATADAGL